MVDVVKLITDSFELYKKNWKKFITGFGALVLIAVLIAVLQIGVSIAGSAACGRVADPNMDFIACISSDVVKYTTSTLEGIVNVVVIVALLIPLYEMVAKKQISNWTGHIVPQLGNSVKLMIFGIVKELIIIAPFAAFLIAVILPMVIAAGTGAGKQTGVAAVLPLLSIGMLVLLIPALIFYIVINFAVNLFLTFLSMEMVVGEKGLFESIKSSFGIVKANFVEVFVFKVVWWLIGIPVAIITMLLACTVCLLPVALLVRPLLVEPVQIISTVDLWKQLTQKK